MKADDGKDPVSFETTNFEGKKLSDSDLVNACGGLTGHKGARHGNKAGGKLARVAEADALLAKRMAEGEAFEEAVVSATMNLPNDDVQIQNGDTKTKKVKKAKKDGCKSCGGPFVEMLLCGQCGAACYCSRSCQIADWKAGHKGACAGAATSTKEFKKKKSGHEKKGELAATAAAAIAAAASEIAASAAAAAGSSNKSKKEKKDKKEKAKKRKAEKKRTQEREEKKKIKLGGEKRDKKDKAPGTNEMESAAADETKIKTEKNGVEKKGKKRKREKVSGL